MDNLTRAALINEIKNRYPGGYELLAEKMRSQIKDYFDNACSDAAALSLPKPILILGLSGGVDSSVSTFLAASAVGPDNVLPITMPAWENDPCTRFAALVRKAIGIKANAGCCEFVITPVVDNLITVINTGQMERIRIGTTGDRTEIDKMCVGNIASRTRVAMLYHISRKLNGRVLGTAVRSEWVLGYAAKYGTPNSCDYGLLDELYKTDVYGLAKVLRVPDEVINAVPTTGYYPGQSHEAELGAPLEELDVLTYLLFDRKLSPEHVASEYGISLHFVNTIMARYNSSKDKRMLRYPHVRIRPEPFNE